MFLPSAPVLAERTDPSVPRLDLLQFEKAVSHYLRQALAPSTTRRYKSGQRRFLHFCPLPLSEQTLSKFIAHLAKEGLTHQTIKCCLSALRFMQIRAGHGRSIC